MAAVLIAAMLSWCVPYPVRAQVSEVSHVEVQPQIYGPPAPTPEEIAAAQAAALVAYQTQLIVKAKKLVGTRQGQCVVAVRKFLGVGRDQIQGMARNTKTNSSTPEVGAIIVLNLSRPGHVGVVLDHNPQTITYFDSNGSWNERAAIRTIAANSKKIKGYRIIN